MKKNEQDRDRRFPGTPIILLVVLFLLGVTFLIFRPGPSAPNVQSERVTTVGVVAAGHQYTHQEVGRVADVTLEGVPGTLRMPLGLYVQASGVMVGDRVTFDCRSDAADPAVLADCSVVDLRR